MTKRLIPTLCWLAAGTGAIARGARGQALAHTRFALANGLAVVVNEDHSSPIVAVDLMYHVGSKDEARGQIQFSHACEHLMGLGSPQLAQPEKELLQSLGGISGVAGAATWASTSEDVTHFYTTVPSHVAETVLWLEADRMALPVARADSASFAAVREVIRAERQQTREEPVYGTANDLLVAA